MTPADCSSTRTTRVKRPRSNGIVEWLHRTLPDEPFRVEGRRTWFETIEEMQVVLNPYMEGYNRRRPHQRRGMNGRTPATAFIEGLLNPQQQREEKSAKTRSRLAPSAHRGSVSR
jgi:transposase InsO family protein